MQVQTCCFVQLGLCQNNMQMREAGASIMFITQMPPIFQKHQDILQGARAVARQAATAVNMRSRHLQVLGLMPGCGESADGHISFDRRQP